MDVVTNDHIRGQGTNADAGYSLQGVFQIGAGFSLFYIQLLFNQFQDRLPSPHMAGCPPTNPNNFSAPWLSVELSIKTYHPLHLTGEKSQASSYEWHRLRRNIPELTLDFLQ